MSRRRDDAPSLAVIVIGGIGVLVVIAFVAAVAFGRESSAGPGDRLAVVRLENSPAGIAVLAGRCDDERVKAVEVRAPGGVALWRIESAKGTIDRRYVVGQDPPPFEFATVVPLQPLPPGVLEAEVTIDDDIDSEPFDPAHLETADAVRAPCGSTQFGAVLLLFALGAGGVVFTYGAMVRRYLLSR